MDAQKRLDFKSGRPAACIEICMFSRARAQDVAAATRFKPQPFFEYCCKTGELNTAICSGSSEDMLCSRQQALERCKSKYSVACSSLNTPVWPAGRRFVLSRARERASRLTEIAVSGLPEAAEEALATTDACGEGAQ